jgi:hypothetical protein
MVSKITAADILEVIVEYCKQNGVETSIHKKGECETWFEHVEPKEYCPAWDKIVIMPGRISKLTQEKPGTIDKVYIGVCGYKPKNSVSTIRKYLDVKL